MGCILGIEPNEHRIPSILDFMSAIRGFNGNPRPSLANSGGVVRRIDGVFSPKHGVISENHGVFWPKHGVISGNHGVFWPKHGGGFWKPWGVLAVYHSQTNNRHSTIRSNGLLVFELTPGESYFLW